jgi:hypothetical protein
MQDSKIPTIGYGPPRKTNIIANVAFGLIAILIVVAIIAFVKDKNKNVQNKKFSAIETSASLHEGSTGEIAHTRFFDIVIDKVSFLESITDSSIMLNLPNEEGSHYMIAEITIKNIDAESKMMPEGELYVEGEKGNNFYQRPETIIAKGWGLLMENIPPGTTKKTKLVYKLPAELKATIFYYPDISYNKDRILLISI